MSPPRRVLNAHLEFAEALRVPAQDAREPQLLKLLLEARRQAGVHAAAAREHDGLEEGGAHVDVGGLDGVEEELGNAGLLDVNEMGLEEALGGLKALAADADDAAVGEGIALDQDSSFLGQFLVQLQVVGDVAELLFDLARGLEVGRAVEGVPAAGE